MTILQLPSWYLPEGGQFVLHQTKALQEAGHTVRILANVHLSWRKYGIQMFNYHRFPMCPFFTEEDGIEMLRYFHRPIPKAIVYNIENWAQHTARLFDIYLKRYGKPDIIHVHSGTWGAYAASIIKKKHNVPYVVTEHRGMFGCKCQLARDFFRPEYDKYFREGFSNADALIPVGDQLIPKMKEFLTRDVPFRVVSNIVDTDFFVPSENSRPHSPFRWVSVNGFYAEKGYDVLLPAFDMLCDSGADVSLRLVGENFESQEFQQMLAKCRNKSRISFAGEVDRTGVLKELQQADAFCLSSRVEAEPVAILEAISCGLPVAGTEVIPSYELTEDLGYRVRVENPAELSNAMLELMTNYSKYSSAKAHQHAVQIANKSGVVSQLVEIYKQVCLLNK